TAAGGHAAPGGPVPPVWRPADGQTAAPAPSGKRKTGIIIAAAAVVVVGIVVLLVLLLCLGRRGSANGLNVPNETPLALWILKRLGLYLLCLLAGAVVSATVAGGGNPLAYLRATAGVGSYQYFYFSGTGGKALLPYIFTNPRLLFFTAGYLVFLGWCLWRLLRGRLGNRTLLAGFLAFCLLVASYAYILSGSGYNFTEALEGFFWLGLAALACRLLLRALRRFQRQVALACTALVTAAALLFGVLAGREALRPEEAIPNGIHSAALGGWTPYPLALGEAAGLVGGEAVFSVYATGLEVETGQFQPSGYDYIIHALGDEARAAYLEDFIEGEYPWVQTTCLGLENWLSVENWDFYRLVAARYEQVLKTEYSWLWRRAEGDLHLDAKALGAKLTLTEEGGRWRITVTAETDTDFVADVRLSYHTGFSSAGGALLSLGRRCVFVNTQSPVEAGASAGAYLPAESGERYIPIAVRGGTGSATISPRDSRYVSLEVTAAELVGALPGRQ
ncbi:hypothetical protein LJC60_10795, partial [Ruminococcaceae bacterium OttesenSCG-928-D13]|nr:hypothetical protein [Ruminococcaceae bacterium OttesenSCG-928-D13]